MCIAREGMWVSLRMATFMHRHFSPTTKSHRPGGVTLIAPSSERAV
jgi:hypothetical protein